MNVAEVSNPSAGLGATTPASMAAMLVATRAGLAFYATAPSPKNWAVTALIAKWGVDQLRSNAVSITLGKDTLQFIQQPDGRYTPPANCTMTLVKTNATYWVQERHGRTFQFDDQNRLTNLVDQYQQPLAVTYLNSTSRLPAQVTDWKGRTLTFTYTGARLTQVADNFSPSRREIVRLLREERERQSLLKYAMRSVPAFRSPWLAWWNVGCAIPAWN
jgi:hypothetical protein